tara:strand:+ start:723 stop:1109 length:387 start_codon:yes stop_codon:yes gene_type:complete
MGGGNMKTKQLTFLLVALILSVTCFTSSSFGFSEPSLQRLKSEKKCINCDLTGADLTGAKLARADLTKADLTGAYLHAVVFCHTTMPDEKKITRVLVACNRAPLKLFYLACIIDLGLTLTDPPLKLIL